MFLADHYSIREVLTFPMLRDHTEHQPAEGGGPSTAPGGSRVVPVPSGEARVAGNEGDRLPK